MNNTITFIENDFSRAHKPVGLLMASGFIATVLLSLAFWLTYGTVLNALAKVPSSHEFEISYREVA